jgi:glycosyltransferase involved in cell wall biosynthesis
LVEHQPLRYLERQKKMNNLIDKTLYLFTNNFPYGNTSEVPFLINEVEFLSHKFKAIVLVPYYYQSDSPLITGQYQVDLSLLKNKIKKPDFRRMMPYFFKRDVFQEFVNLSFAGERAKRKRLLECVNRASAVAKWVSQKVGFNASAIFYTYWFTDRTTGLAFAKNEGAKIPIISRAHGYDLYEERNALRYFPLRSYTLRFIDRLFLISQNGYDYICAKFPVYKEKFENARLGVIDQETWTPPSQNEKQISIVSCAFLKPVKRINLLCDAIDHLSLIYKDWSIKWDHFGGGNQADFDALKSRINEFKPNVNAILWGNVPNKIILDYYRNNSVDFLVSVSESEGTPMSMMEAMSFGIPVISTDVGGVRELVTESCGMLIPKNINAEQIASAMGNFINDKRHITLRPGVKESCRNSYSANRNYSNFAEEISEIQ